MVINEHFVSIKNETKMSTLTPSTYDTGVPCQCNGARKRDMRLTG